MLAKYSSNEDREFLFPNDRVLGTFLTAHPAAVFFLLSLTCSTVLFIPAWLLDIHSIWVPPVQYCPKDACAGGVSPCISWDSTVPSSDNVGFFYKLNWSLTYPLVVPIIFALAAAACRSVRSSFIELFTDGTVQPDKDNEKTDSTTFLEAISRHLRKWDRPILGASIVISIVASIFDAWNNLKVYGKVFFSNDLADWYKPCLWDDIDWMHGWTITGHQGSWAHMYGNFLFYFLALTVQGITIFLACYFVLKFLVLTQSFSSIIIREDSGFHFEPFVSDPERRLGLRPIGKLFSMFLVASIIFQIYAFGHRVGLILGALNTSVIDYFSIVGKGFRDLGKATDGASVEQALSKLVYLACFRSVNHGLIIVFVLMVIPMIVIAWWPIYRLRHYLSVVMKKKLKEYRASEAEARKTHRYDEAEHLAKDMEKLKNASIWPNGYKVGWGSFFFLSALLISTFFPPLVVPLVSGGLGLKILMKITSKKEESS